MDCAYDELNFAKCKLNNLYIKMILNDTNNIFFRNKLKRKFSKLVTAYHMIDENNNTTIKNFME